MKRLTVTVVLPSAMEVPAASDPTISHYSTATEYSPKRVIFIT